MSLIVEGVVELVQEVAGDCCFVVEDVVGLAQEVAGDCCFIVEGVELVQEVPGIYCLLVEGLVELQGQPLGRLDDALDVDGILYQRTRSDQNQFLIIHPCGSCSFTTHLVSDPPILGWCCVASPYMKSRTRLIV